MYRILIIDDEKIVLDSSRYILESNYENITVETARNGKEGLIKLDSFKPHIIITDIRMPGISGIEFIKKARKVDLKVKILIITAYEQFEYAKEAFKYNVEDYILKPLCKGKLLESLNKIIQKIEGEKERRDEELESIEKYYKSINLVENNFFYSVFFKNDCSKYYNQYRELLSIDLVSGFIIAIEFRDLSEEAHWSEVSDYHVKLNQCTEYLKSHFKYNYDAIVSNLFINKLFIYIERSTPLEPSLLDFLNSIHDYVWKKFRFKTRISIGSIKKIDDLYQSYEQALILLKGDITKVAVYDEKQIYSTDPAYYNDLLESLIDCYSNKNKKFFHELDAIKDYYIMIYKENNTIALNGLIETLSILHFLTKDYLSIKENIDKQFIEKICNNDALDALSYFIEQASKWFDIYIQSEFQDYSVITSKALDIINAHYKEDLSLEQVSQKINVTPQYLSKIFSQETSKSFKEFIACLRVEDAKILLMQDQKMSISNVSYQVGYNDPNYFIRIFKKYTGYTPKEYRKVFK